MICTLEMDKNMMSRSKLVVVRLQAAYTEMVANRGS